MLPTRPLTSLPLSVTKFGDVIKYVAIIPSKVGGRFKSVARDAAPYLMVDDFLTDITRAYMMDALQIIRIPLMCEVREHPVTKTWTVIVWNSSANWKRFKAMAQKAIGAVIPVWIPAL